ncbi:MAG: hypothetical protein ABI648_03965 [Betaproteobacteria bacterium]
MSPVTTAPGPDAQAAQVKVPGRLLDDYVAEISERTQVRRGVPLPMGLHDSAGAVNFSLFSRRASRARLELFDEPADVVPARIIVLDPMHNRTGDVWHVWIEGIRPGQLHAYRLHGPYQPGEGHRFNFNRLHLHAFATAISPLPDWDFGGARGYDASAPGPDLVYSKIDNARAMPVISQPSPRGFAASTLKENSRS